MTKKWVIYQSSRDVLLNKAKYYYKNNKERLRKQARDKSRNLSEEEKKKLKREYGKNRYIWRKKTKIKGISKKISWVKKVSILVVCFAANIIMNKIVF